MKDSTRERIVDAADRLVYERGYEHTSFADIASEVAISRGNFYYHFKTKDEILAAVIARRLDRTGAMLAGWEADGDSPAERIRSFVRMLVMNRVPISRHGCPVGSLCGELGKLAHPASDDARQLFTLFRDWLRRQFALLGHEADADALAMHLLARSQGIAVLASAFGDEAFIEQEAAQLLAWLQPYLPNPSTPS
jgi:TetR/AcrR family transcriptional repressor of nem operon